MSVPWFHLDPLPASGERASLAEDEARHARGARRLREGDRVVVFDGAGGFAEARLQAVSKREISLDVGPRQQQPRPTPEIHLASALPKGDRLATLLGMATQLGMHSFAPLACERSIVAGAAQPERWSRILREACKQSRRAHIPELRTAITPAAAIDTQPSGARPILLDPNGMPAARWIETQSEANLSPIQVLVGPEGGFSDAEFAAMIGRGATPISLGDAILRIETAAVAGLAAFGLLCCEPRRNPE